MTDNSPKKQNIMTLIILLYFFEIGLKAHLIIRSQIYYTMISILRIFLSPTEFSIIIIYLIIVNAKILLFKLT